MNKFRAAVATAVAVAILAGAVPSERVARALPPTPTATTQVPPIIGNDLNGVIRNVPTRYFAAIDWFESRAVSSVLETHSLPEGDRTAVMAWGRDAVRTQLFLDLLAIINEEPALRTPNEALVYEYFQQVYKDQLIDGAQAAVDEYLAWSGLTLDTIDQDPIPVTLDGRGYCRYQPPENVNQGIAPFGLVYNASQLPQCFSAQASLSCTTLPTGCPAPWPSEEQFQLWGRYRSQQETYDDPVYRNLAFETATGIGLASSMVATGVGTATARAFLAGPIEGTKLFTKVFPYAGKAVFQSGPNVTQVAIQSANAATKAAGAAVRAASIAFVVGTVISAVLTIALETWTIVERSQINRNLLRFLDEARNSSPDLKALVEKEDGASALLSTFLSTTAIDVDLDCRLPDADFPTSRFPCANAPALPAPTATDPVFYVTTPSAQGAVGRFSDSIYLVNPVSSSDTVNLNVDVRLSGNGWFVGTKYDGSRSENQVVPGGTPGASNQALRLYYADWDRSGKVATRVIVEGRPMFAVTSLQEDEVGACLPAAQLLPMGVCLTDTIQFLQPDGTRATATVVASDATGPNVDAVVPDRVEAGQPVTLSATATARFGDPPFTYVWSVPGQPDVGGASVTTTFRRAGPTTVTLTVTDSSGASTVRGFPVLVAQNTSVEVLTLPSGASAIDSRVQVWARVQAQEAEGVQCASLPVSPPPPPDLVVGGCLKPTGVVQFFLNGTPIGPPVTTTPVYQEPCVGACEILVGGNRTFAPAFELPIDFPVGSNLAITATYRGDNGFVGASSPATTLTVSKAQPVVEITSGPLYPSPQATGPITAEVRSASATGPVPTGLVQFFTTGNVAGGRFTLGGPVPIDANGTATAPITNLSFTPNLFAAYEGDGNFAAGESAVNPVQFPPVNLAPVTSSLTPRVDEDGEVAISLVDSIFDDQTTFEDLTIAIVQDPANGLLTTGPGGWTYRPNPDFSGEDRFTFSVTDDGAPSGCGQVSATCAAARSSTGVVIIEVTPVNDPPSAMDDSITIDEDAPATTIDVLGNDLDPDRDVLTITANTPSMHGSVTCSTTACSYRPGPDYHGPDEFTYTMTDGAATSTARVQITVDPVDDPPRRTGPARTIGVVGSGPTTIEVLDGVVDPEGGPVAVLSFTQPVHGSLTCTPAGRCEYTPNAGYTGPDSFTVTVGNPGPPALARALTSVAQLGLGPTADLVVTLEVTGPTAPGVTPTPPPAPAPGVTPGAATPPPGSTGPPTPPVVVPPSPDAVAPPATGPDLTTRLPETGGSPLGVLIAALLLVCSGLIAQSIGRQRRPLRPPAR